MDDTSVGQRDHEGILVRKVYPPLVMPLTEGEGTFLRAPFLRASFLRAPFLRASFFEDLFFEDLFLEGPFLRASL